MLETLPRFMSSGRSAGPLSRHRTVARPSKFSPTSSLYYSQPYLSRLNQVPPRSPAPLCLSARHFCPKCNKTFPWLCSLKRHMLIHAAEDKMPLYSSSGYSRASNRKAAASRKRDLPPPRLFVCDKCNMDFPSKMHLMRHINSVHGYPMEMNYFSIASDCADEPRQQRPKRRLVKKIQASPSQSSPEVLTDSSVPSGYSDDEGLGVEKKLDQKKSSFVDVTREKRMQENVFRKRSQGTVRDRRQQDSTKEKLLPEIVKIKKPLEAKKDKKQLEIVKEKKHPEAVRDKKPLEAVKSKKLLEVVKDKKPLEVVKNKKSLEIVKDKKPPEAVKEKKLLEVVKDKKPLEVTRDKTLRATASDAVPEKRTRVVRKNSTVKSSIFM